MMAARRSLQAEIRRLALLLSLVVAAVVGVSLWYGHTLLMRQSSRIFESYIASYPLLFPPAAGPCDPALPEALLRYTRGEEDSAELRLDVVQLNCLIAHVPDLRDTLRVTALSEDRLRALISLPFVYGGRLRYLNGSAALGYDFQLGRLRVVLRELSVAGRRLPERYVESIAHDFAAVIYPDPLLQPEGIPEARELLWQTREIAIKGGRVLLLGVQGSRQ